MDRDQESVCLFYRSITSKNLVEEENMWSQLENIFIDKYGKPMKGGATIK